jgi:hypothetical protein
LAFVTAALVVGAGALAGEGAAQVTSVAVGCWDAIYFEIANPTPGSRVEPGSYVIQGVALDARADNGTPGIDAIDFFLGDRDQGGTIVGHAVPSSTGPLGDDSFQTVITVPGSTGPQELFGYAHSSVTV